MNATPNLKRVLLVDDHPSVLERVAELLTGSFEVIGKLASGAGIDSAVARSCPDLIVLDITLPGESGFTLARRLTSADPPVCVVFLTVHEDSDFASEALAAGGLGYVTKPRIATDLAPAIHAALAGRYFISACPALEKFKYLNGTSPGLSNWPSRSPNPANGPRTFWPR